MKKILTAVCLSVVAVAAVASDGGLYGDYERVEYRRAQPAQVKKYEYQPIARQSRCGGSPCGAPVRVKVGTEIIDHYQEFQPVVYYEPSRTYSVRRTVKPCND
ncbi:MAG: hypothetical protein LBO08_00575 [Rickettsiales bacterium]|jgi:hypothetical protein|nr:hypothetical protein [Rickettsiales bacterium]